MTGTPLARRLVVGLAGLRLSPVERAWLVAHQPGGVILFLRNCHDRKGLSSMCEDLHELVPGLEIMADHEGDLVSELRDIIGAPPAPPFVCMRTPGLTPPCEAGL